MLQMNRSSVRSLTVTTSFILYFLPFGAYTLVPSIAKVTHATEHHKDVSFSAIHLPESTTTGLLLVIIIAAFLSNISLWYGMYDMYGMYGHLFIISLHNYRHQIVWAVGQCVGIRYYWQDVGIR